MFVAFAFDQHDGCRTSRDELVRLCGFPSSDFGPDHPLRRSASVERVLGPPIPYFYSAIYPEPLQKNPPSATVKLSCDSTEFKKKKEGGGKWRGEINAPLSADVERP